jgi:hypothetical protein
MFGVYIWLTEPFGQLTLTYRDRSRMSMTERFGQRYVIAGDANDVDATLAIWTWKT